MKRVNINIGRCAGLVEGWAAILMGMLAGSVPWYTLNVVHKNSELLKQVDDTMAVFHTHAVAGSLGGVCVGIFAEPRLCDIFYPITGFHGLLYSWKHHGGHIQGLKQVCWQVVGIAFVVAWNVIITSIICLVLRIVVDLRMKPDALEVGDDAIHGEEAYALWGDGQFEKSVHDVSGRDGRIESATTSGLATPRFPNPNDSISLELADLSYERR